LNIRKNKKYCDFLFIDQEQHFSSLHSKNKKGKISQKNQNKHDSDFKNFSRVTKKMKR
jgi:hypothetical protein